jgi:PKD repeat protein
MVLVALILLLALSILPIPATAAANWYNTSWPYRQNITINKVYVNGTGITLTNFPVLVSITDTYLTSSQVQSNGNDILFTASDGVTKLPHEIESFTQGTGTLVAWVNVPSVTNSTNTTIYIYYGNLTVSGQQNPTGVWDANYTAVWHLAQNPAGTAPQELDSTSNANSATNGGGNMTAAQQVQAKIDGGLTFNGFNDYLTTNYVQTAVVNYTIETWMKTSTTNLQQAIVQDRGTDAAANGTGQSLTLSIGGTYPGAAGAAGDVAYGLDSNAIYIGDYSTKVVNDNNWHMVAGTWSAPSGTTVSANQFTIYIDGVPVAQTALTQGTAPASPLTGLFGTQIAQHQPWTTFFNGTLDELRISKILRSPNWISTEYNNQNSPGTFLTVYPQEYPPVSSGFTGTPTSGLYPLTVQFNLTSMFNNATYVNWSWGDGAVTNTSTLLTFNASHTYSSGGTYTVNETAANPTYTNITSLSNYITVYNQTVSGFTSNVTFGLAPLAVQFNLTSMNNNATYVNWSWGDGAVTNATTLLTFNATHTYSSAGIYTVNETAVNPYDTNITLLSNYISVYNKTISGFTGTPTSGLFPLTVQFNLTSMFNNATYVNWSWGDGSVTNTSTLLAFNASHTYSSGGTYTVNETAANPSYTNITSLSNYITVYNQTVSGFTGTPTSGLYPLTVTFTLTSMNNNATYANWSFGDGTFFNTTTIAAFNATHQYTAGGVYTVNETAGNPYYTNITSLSNYISVYNQTVSGFTGTPTSGLFPLAVQFNLTPMVNYPILYIGNLSSTTTASETGGILYVDNYTTSVPLNAINISTYGTLSGNVMVSIYSDNNGYPGTLLFTAVTNTGTTANSWDPVAIPTTYLAPGNYWLAFDCSATRVVRYQTAPASTIQFYQTLAYGTAFPANPTTGSWTTQTARVGKINFTAVSTQGSPTAAWVNWSFGDGTVFNTTTLTAFNASHTYSSGGTYTVNETAANPSYTNITSLSNYITVYNQTVSGFTSNVTSGISPLGVQFNLTAMNNNASYVNWSFGDGTVTNATTLLTFNASHLYNSAGFYTVNETAVNPYNSSISVISNYISVYGKTVSGFFGTPTSGLFPLAVQFNRTIPNDNATMWNWSANGNVTWFNTTSANLGNYTRAFSTGGTYSVTFVAQNPYYLNTTVRSNYISVYNTTISGFTSNVTYGSGSFGVQFNLTTMNNNATYVNWSFGDGSCPASCANLTSPAAFNASHSYSGGTYTVSESAANPYYTNITTLSNYISPYVAITLNESAINLALIPGTPAIDTSLGITVSANAPFAITVADNTGRSSGQGYMGNYTGTAYNVSPLNTDLASPIGLAGTTTGTTSAGTINPPILASGQTLYTGTAAVTNQLLAPNTFTQPVAYNDQVLPSGSTYRIDLLYSITIT